jgi:hypothetical protein
LRNDEIISPHIAKTKLQQFRYRIHAHVTSLDHFDGDEDPETANSRRSFEPSPDPVQPCHQSGDRLYSEQLQQTS